MLIGLKSKTSKSVFLFIRMFCNIKKAEIFYTSTTEILLELGIDFFSFYQSHTFAS